MLLRYTRFLSSLMYWLLPSTCLLCGRLAKRERDLCVPCEADLPWLKYACRQCARPLAEANLNASCGNCLITKPAFDYTVALWHYRAPIDTLILELKFQHKLVNAKLMGQLLAQQIKSLPNFADDVMPECLIPIPLHKSRLQERGYNQALEIARAISKHLQIPIDWRYCHRIRATAAQTLIPAQLRYQNVKGAFAVSQVRSYRHVAIIDDVMTTGSTIAELSLLLRKQGVERIDVWCCARASD